jgi:hypothetical protein
MEDGMNGLAGRLPGYDDSYGETLTRRAEAFGFDVGGYTPPAPTRTIEGLGPVTVGASDPVVLEARRVEMPEPDNGYRGIVADVPAMPSGSPLTAERAPGGTRAGLEAASAPAGDSRATAAAPVVASATPVTLGWLGALVLGALFVFLWTRDDAK